MAVNYKLEKSVSDSGCGRFMILNFSAGAKWKDEIPSARYGLTF